MDVNTINECTQLSLSGKITFPEVVMRLAAIGIERYQVDLVAFKKFTYSEDGAHHFTDFTLEDRPAVASNFNANGVKQAIADIQQQKTDYQIFLRQIMLAGCCHYEVYIHGRKVIYFGRDGSQHVELFPAAK